MSTSEQIHSLPTEDPPPSELDRLDPESTSVKLESGLEVTVLPLKMRQLFRLLRIVTRGGAQFLPQLQGSFEDPEEFGLQFVSVVLLSLPEAEDETVAFLQSVVEPADLETGSAKAVRERNENRRADLFAELDNPEPGDVVTIVEKVFEQEREDLMALGKRIGAMFSVAQKTGQLPKDQAEGTTASSEASPARTTSSRRSTAGGTRRSRTAPSGG